MAAPMENSAIPFVDFAKWGDGTGTPAKEIGQQFYSACRDVGFAYLINHGIADETIQGMFEYSKRFFELPVDVKLTAKHPPEGDNHRGYSGIGVEQLSQMVFDGDELEKLWAGKGGDHKESFDIGSEVPGGHQNLWVDEEHIPGFKSFCLRYRAEFRKMQVMVLRALALGMPGVPPGFFDDYHSEGNNSLRLLHYPSAPTEVFESGEKGRINAHTDYSTCTFLVQDDVGGLEVEDPTNPGDFLPAPPVPGAIVFNIGDLLMRWSNDVLKSTLHRVVAPPPKANDDTMTRERFSMPYFCSPNPDKMIEALPGTWSDAKPKRYTSISAQEYVGTRLNATYAGGLTKLKGGVAN